MKNVLKWGLIVGGAGYLLFRNQVSAMFGGSTPAPETASPAAAAATTTAQMIQQYATANSMPGQMTFDQWNWVYAQVRGAAGPAIEDIFPGQDRGRLMTFAQYWAGMSAKGLSGIRRRSTAARAWGY